MTSICYRLRYCAGMFFVSSSSSSRQDNTGAIPVLLYFHGNYETVGQHLSQMLQRMANVFGMHVMRIGVGPICQRTISLRYIFAEWGQYARGLYR